MHALSSVGFPLPEAEMLGLDPGETDPVRIILAAQLRLRCCRRFQPAVGQRFRPSDVPRIVAARDALLRRAVGAMIRRGLGCRVDGG
jgi:hypothetical protein